LTTNTVKDDKDDAHDALSSYTLHFALMQATIFIPQLRDSIKLSRVNTSLAFN